MELAQNGTCCVPLPKTVPPPFQVKVASRQGWSSYSTTASPGSKKYDNNKLSNYPFAALFEEQKSLCQRMMGCIQCSAQLKSLKRYTVLVPLQTCFVPEQLCCTRKCNSRLLVTSLQYRLRNPWHCCSMLELALVIAGREYWTQAILGK